MPGKRDLAVQLLKKSQPLGPRAQDEHDRIAARAQRLHAGDVVFASELLLEHPGGKRSRRKTREPARLDGRADDVRSVEDDQVGVGQFLDPFGHFVQTEAHDERAEPSGPGRMDSGMAATRSKPSLTDQNQALSFETLCATSIRPSASSPGEAGPTLASTRPVLPVTTSRSAWICRS